MRPVAMGRKVGSLKRRRGRPYVAVVVRGGQLAFVISATLRPKRPWVDES